VNEWIARLGSAFAGLSSRERLLVSIVGGLSVVALVFLLVIGPLMSLSDRGEQRLETADQQLRAMERLRREYDDVEQRLADTEQRIQSGSRGNLRTSLEALAKQATVKVESMEPQASSPNDSYRETKVEVGLRGVTLTQTVTYLHQIEASPEALSVKSLRIRTRPEKPELLDVSFTVSSFEPL